MKIKVCGMTQLEQIAKLDELNIDFVGFIFYPKSARYVLNHLSTLAIKNLKGGFKKVGVFVNASVEEVLEMVEACGLDLVQLHGDEMPLYCERIAAEVPTIKAFRILNNDDILYKIAPYQEVVDYFLFDTNTESFGGSGKKFDWDILKDLSIQKPFFISGGIDDTDINGINTFISYPVASRLFAIDVNSRFEIEPGVKNIKKITNFVDELRKVKL